MAGTQLTALEFNRAQALVAKMLGAGEGDYGYNQPTLNSLPANGVNSYPAAPALSADHIIALRKDILMLAYHQTGPIIPSAKTIPEIVNDQVTTTITDRILLATIGARSATGSLPSTPNGWLLAGRTTMWSKSRVILDPLSTILQTDEWNGTTTHTFTITFTDENAMRCYFNAGSAIEISPSKSGTTSTQNTKWNSLLVSVGKLRFQKTITTSTKASAIKESGYDALVKAATDTVNPAVTIFTKSSTSGVYTVKAAIEGENSIVFTSTFSNIGPTNVTGTLSTAISAYHATILENDDPLQYINIPSPTCETAYEIGEPNSVISITRTPALSQLTETGKTTNIAYTFHATNFTGNTVYYTIVKDIISKPPSASDIEIADFIDIPLESSITLVSTGSSKAGTLNITVSPDTTTEGLDKFDIEFRATDNADDPVLISIKSAFGRTVAISDTSLTPKVLARTLKFSTLTVGKIPSVKAGSKVSFGITGKNLIAPNDEVTWKIISVPGTNRGLTADDFTEGLEGSFNMPVSQNYTLDLTIESDAKFDAVEKFQVALYLTDPVTRELNSKPTTTSYIVQITSTVEIVPIPYTLLAPSALTMEETGKVGISIPFTTPYLAPTAAKVWYQITAADSENGISAKNKIEATDFTDKLIKGSCPVTVKGNSGSGTLKKIAAADSAIEGTEGFIVEFFEDKDYTKSFGKTDTIRITETVGYTVDVSSRSMREPLPTGTTSTGTLPKSITFTLKTPYIENDPATSVHWKVMAVDPAPSGGIGTFTADDFEEGIEGDTPVVDNKVVLTLTASNDGMTEGVEQFYVRFTLTVNDVAITKDSPIVLVTEVVAYKIAKLENSPSTVNEQPTGTTEGFEYVIKTPYLPPNTPIYWEVIPENKTSVFEKTDFTIGQYSGQLIINQNGNITNEATLSLVPVVDTKIEGSESFHVIVKTSPSKTSEVARTLQPSTINEDFKPFIYVASKSLTEGATGLTFNITVPKTNVGTKVYWKITGSKGTITPSDFSVTDAEGKNRQATSGHVLTTKTNTAVLSIAARQDAVANSSNNTEDEEKFTVSIGMSASADEATTEELSITDISSYIVTADVTSVVETDGSLLGSKSKTVNFNVYTPFFSEGHTLYYTVKTVAGTVNSDDFIIGKVQDTFQVYGNFAKLMFTIKDDKLTEINEKFFIEIRETGFTSPVVKGGTSPGVLIYNTSNNSGGPVDDTEISATITSLDNKMEYTEGDTMHLRISTVGVLPSDDLNWSTMSFITGGIGQYLSAANSTTALHVIGTATAASVDVTITVNTTASAEGFRPFIFQVHKGAIATDPIGFAPFVIKDAISYSVEPTLGSINEAGNTSTRFNVITPLSNTTLKWKIEAAEGSDIQASDFSVPSQYSFDSSTMTGTVSIGANGTGSFTLSAATDAVTEGTEKFRITLLKPASGGGYDPILNVQSSIVNISDLVDYTLTLTSAGMTNYTVPANTPVIYTLTTPKLVSSTMSSPWTVSLTGTGANSVATAPVPFVVNTTDTTYTFTVTTKSNITSNGSFNVKILRANGSQVVPVSPPPTINVTAPLVYQITATKRGSLFSDTTISETDTLTVGVQSSTTPVYWYIAQDRSDEATTAAIDGNDFPSPRALAGTVNSKLTSFDLTFANPQKRKDGTKKFHLFLSLTAPTTPLQSPLPAPIPGAETATITKTQVAVYTITPSTTKVVEGFPVTFTVTTPYIASNVSYKWQVVPVSGSITTVTADSPATQDSTGSLTGQFTINSTTKSGTVTITVPATPADDTRTYQLKIFDNNNVVVIDTTDTTKNPIITVGSNVGYSIVATASATSTAQITSIMEGGLVTFKVTRPTASTITKIKWEVSKDGITGSDFLTTHVTSTSVSGTGSFDENGNYTFTVTTKIDSPLVRNNNANRKFKIKLYDNTSSTLPVLLETTQSDITITDYEYLSVTDNLGTVPANTSPIIREGNTGTGTDETLPTSVTFTVIAKPADVGLRLNYKITGSNKLTSGTFLNNTPLTGTTDLVTLNSTGPYVGLCTVDFTLTTVADSTTNDPANKTFSVMFTRSGTATGETATNTCTSRTIAIKDTSKTDTPRPYLIEDTGQPVSGEVSINEGNVITFKVHARPTDTGLMYYSIRKKSSTVKIAKTDLIKDGVGLTSLEGTVPITDGYAILTLTTVLDNATNSSAKGFFVLFSTSLLTSDTVQNNPNLKSRVVTIVDTSKTAVLVSNITPTLSYSPAGCFVLPATTFDIESKITPVTVATSMTWRISGAPSVLKKIKYNNTAVDPTKLYSATSKSTNRSGASESQCHFLSLTFTVDSVTASEDVCGSFTITFSVSQYGVEKTVSATLELNHNQLDNTKKITTDGLYPKSNELVGIDYMSVKLVGGGGASGSKGQGIGAAGDIVTSLIPAKPLYFRFIPGAAGGPQQTSGVDWAIYEGGTGGTAVAVYENQRPASDSVAPLATAAGGGGAGTSWGGDGTRSRDGKSTGVSTTYNPKRVNIPTQPVSGVGGSGGGTDQVSGGGGGDDDSGGRYDRPGGYGGISFVPASWNRKASSNTQSAYAEVSFYKKCGTSTNTNKPIELAIAGIYDVTVPAGVTYAKVIAVGGGGGGGAAGGTSVTPDNKLYPSFTTTKQFVKTLYPTTYVNTLYMNTFGIYGGPDSLSLTATFRTTFLAPTTPTKYSLFYQGRGNGSITIDKATYSFTTMSNEPVKKEIILTSTFNRTISVSTSMNTGYTVFNALPATYAAWGMGSNPAGANALFNVNIIAAGYTVSITTNNGGTGYKVGEQVKILGTAVGGHTPANDVSISVATVDSKGKITKISPAFSTGYGVSLKDYCVAAWIIEDGPTEFADAIPPGTTTTTSTYRQADILWSTRSPANLITKTSGVGASNGSSGGGGGGGSIVISTIPLIANETLKVTVGAGGDGGTAKSDLGTTSTPSTNGKAGETTTIVRPDGTTIVSAPGGAGGSTFTTGAAAGGAGGTGKSVANATDSGTNGNPGNPGVVNKTTSVTVSKGGAGGNNTSSYGIGGAGGDLTETTQDTIFLPGIAAGNGYVAIVWETGSAVSYGCTPTVATVNTPSITSIETKWSHYANGEGKVTLTFTDERWTTAVTSYNVWCTPVGLGTGYPSSEYLLTTITPTSKTSTTTKHNIWVTTFTGNSSNLTKLTLRIEAVNKSNARVYDKTLEKPFTASSFSNTKTIDEVYTFNFS